MFQCFGSNYSFCYHSLGSEQGESEEKRQGELREGTLLTTSIRTKETGRLGRQGGAGCLKGGKRQFASLGCSEKSWIYKFFAGKEGNFQAICLAGCQQGSHLRGTKGSCFGGWLPHRCCCCSSKICYQFFSEWCQSQEAAPSCSRGARRKERRLESWGRWGESSRHHSNMD